jgi:hypothetical protein
MHLHESEHIQNATFSRMRTRLKAKMRLNLSTLEMDHDAFSGFAEFGRAYYIYERDLTRLLYSRKN